MEWFAYYSDRKIDDILRVLNILSENGIKSADIKISTLFYTEYEINSVYYIIFYRAEQKILLK